MHDPAHDTGPGHGQLQTKMLVCVQAHDTDRGHGQLPAKCWFVCMPMPIMFFQVMVRCRLSRHDHVCPWSRLTASKNVGFVCMTASIILSRVMAKHAKMVNFVCMTIPGYGQLQSKMVCFVCMTVQGHGQLQSKMLVCVRACLCP